jgi:RHS repeat-associated protein
LSGTGETTEYEWDHRNRLTKIVEKDATGAVLKTVNYTYDPLNRRIAKEIALDSGPSTLSFFINDGDRAAREGAGDHVVLQLDGNGDTTNAYLQGAAIDQILADEQFDSSLPSQASSLYWPLADNLGSIRDVAEHDASTGETDVTYHVVYSAFGEITSVTDGDNNPLSASDFPLSFGFTGRERDEESDLQYNRARYYDAAIGQWANEDPLGFDAGDANLRRYVGNKSTFAVDPSGLVDPTSVIAIDAVHNVAIEANRRERTLYVPMSIVRCAVCHGDANGRFVNILGANSARPGEHQLETLKLLAGESSRIATFDDIPAAPPLTAKLDRAVESLNLSPRARGTVRVGQAAIEYAVAMPLAAAPEPLTSVAGYGIGVHATDVLNAGVNEIVTNQYQRTYTSRVLQYGFEQTPAFVTAEPMAEFVDAIGPAPFAGPLQNSLNASHASLRTMMSRNTVSRLSVDQLRALTPEARAARLVQLRDANYARRAEDAVQTWYQDVFPTLSKTKQNNVNAIAGVYDPTRSGAFGVAVNGAPPIEIAPQLHTAALRIATIGEKTSCGFRLGRCAEFRGANDLMLRFGSNLDDIRFVETMVPDTHRGGLMAKEFCDNCVNTFFDNIAASKVYNTAPKYMQPMQNTNPYFEVIDGEWIIRRGKLIELD